MSHDSAEAIELQRHEKSRIEPNTNEEPKSSSKWINPDGLGRESSAVGSSQSAVALRCVYAGVGAALGAAMVAVGATGLGDCQGEPMIPIWLLGKLGVYSIRNMYMKYDN